MNLSRNMEKYEDDSSELFKEKRSQFSVEIRKKKKEEMINFKRVKLLEEKKLDGLKDFKIVNLNRFFFHSTFPIGWHPSTKHRQWFSELTKPKERAGNYLRHSWNQKFSLPSSSSTWEDRFVFHRQRDSEVSCRLPEGELPCLSWATKWGSLGIMQYNSNQFPSLWVLFEEQHPIQFAKSFWFCWGRLFR